MWNFKIKSNENAKKKMASEILETELCAPKIQTMKH